jgi:polyisoprenoid-binding protein YceI
MPPQRSFGAAILLLACSLASLHGEARVYDLKPDPESQLQLWVDKTGLLSGKRHQLEFERYGGTLTVDPASPESGKVEWTAETAAIVVKDKWLSAKDQKKVQEYAWKDMLNASAHPQVKFTSTGVRKGPDGTLDVDGNLTIKGITKPVSVRATLTSKGDALQLNGTSKFKMSLFGLKPPSAALGAIGTKDEMLFEFKLKAVPRP